MTSALSYGDFGNKLHTANLRVNLLDTGVFGDGTVLLHVDTSTEGLSTPEVNAAGIAPATTYANSTIGFSLAVVDGNGQASKIAAPQAVNSTFTLVDKISNAVAPSIEGQRLLFNMDHLLDAGPYLDIVLKTFLDGDIDNLSLKGTWTGYNADKSLPLLDGLLANAAALQNAGDLLTESGISNALALADPRYGQRGFGLFSAFAGYSQTFSTSAGSYLDSSHLDYEGVSFVGGPALNYDSPYGHLLLGAFLEGGQGDYDTADYFKIRRANGLVVGKYGVDGGGDSGYIGAGLFARHDFEPGYYAEVSVRGGRVSNEFFSSDMGPGVKYKTESNYLGLHGGLGYRYEYKPGLMLDAYGKIYYTRIDGDSPTTTDGMALNFEDADFLRTRLGLRYTRTLTEALGLTVGGAWDYNFGDNYGSYKGTVGPDQTAIRDGEEPSLKGSSGVLELGLEYKPWEDRGLSLALSGKAYLGRVEGGSGTLMLKYVFGGSESGPSSARGYGRQPSFGDASASLTRVLTGKISASDSAGGPVGPALSAAGEEEAGEGGGDSAVTLETVTVYSEPNWKQLLSPGAVSVVVPDDYKGEQKSLGDLLDAVPGLHVNKRGGSGQYTTVNVRGSTSAQVGLYIDGVPQNTAGDPTVDLSLYSSENVARIEVYKGYIPVRFVGAPLGGVINIVTKKPADQNTTLSAGARSNGGFQSNGLFSTPLLEGSLLLSATRDQSDGDFKYDYWQMKNLNPPNPHPTRWRQNNSHQKTDVTAKWQTEKVSLQAGWKEMDRYYPSSIDRRIQGYETVDLYYDQNNPWNRANRRNRQQVLERDLTAGYRGDWGDLNWGLQAEYKNSVKDFRWEDGVVTGLAPASGELWSVYDTDRWGLTVDAAYKLGERNMLEFTGNYTREKMAMEGNDWFDPQDTYRVKMQSDFEQKSLYLQLQDTITMRDDLWLTLILRGYQVKSSGIDTTRYDSGQRPIKHGDPTFSTDGGKFNSTWGVAVKKNVGEQWSFKATGGTFIRYPNFYELFGDGVYIRPALWDAENIPLPVPEKGEQWDFTVEWNGDVPGLKTPGHLAVTYFTRRTEDMIGLYQTPYYVYYGNYGKHKAAGFELEAGLKSTYLDLDFSATWLESELVELVTGGVAGGLYAQRWAEGDEILNSPQWETNLRADLRQPWLDWLSFFAEHHYTSSVPIAYVAQGKLQYEESLHLVNLGLRAEIAKGLLLTAGVNDVFNKAPKQGYYDQSHEEWGSSTVFFPKEGRVYYSTLQYIF